MLAVRPTVAVQQYAGNHVDLIAAGRRLDVDALLAGSVQRSGKRIRVTAQLIRVWDGAPIWADKFDDAFTNIFALQDSISERLAQALSMKLTGAEYALMTKRQTENTEAYQLYLEGQYLASKRVREMTQRAVEYYQQAITKDPEYALPYAEMAFCDIRMAGFGWGGGLIANAREA